MGSESYIKPPLFIRHSNEGLNQKISFRKRNIVELQWWETKRIGWFAAN